VAGRPITRMRRNGEPVDIDLCSSNYRIFSFEPAGIKTGEYMRVFGGKSLGNFIGGGGYRPASLDPADYVMMMDEPSPGAEYSKALSTVHGYARLPWASVCKQLFSYDGGDASKLVRLAWCLRPERVPATGEWRMRPGTAAFRADTPRASFRDAASRKILVCGLSGAPPTTARAKDFAKARAEDAAAAMQGVFGSNANGVLERAISTLDLLPLMDPSIMVPGPGPSAFIWPIVEASVRALLGRL
jgi:hypothetical protein